VIRLTLLGRVVLLGIFGLGAGTVIVARLYQKAGLLKERDERHDETSLLVTASVADPAMSDACRHTVLGRPLRVGIVSWPGYAGGIVANNGFKPNRESIYFRQHHLCVEFVLMEDMEVRNKAFATGGKDGVDVVWSTVDLWAYELPGLLKKGFRARAVMQVDWSRGGDAIVADESIKRIEDLYGKRISLAKFTPSHWLLEFNLESSSLDEGQREEIEHGLQAEDGSNAARARFVAGKVDAAVVWEPDVTMATRQRRNSHVLVSSRDARKLISDVMVAREDFIREHGEVIEAFVEGWVVDGTVQASRDPDNVVRLLMENEPLYDNAGPAETLKSLSTVEWAGLADNTEMFNLDGRDPDPLFNRIFDQAAQTWVARRYITAGAAPAAAKDDKILRDLYQRYPVERIPDVFPTPAAGISTRTALAEQEVTINFGVDSAGLDASALSVIDEQLGLRATAFSGALVRVEGNTDDRGDAGHNRALSRWRAQAVADYLVDRYHLSTNQFVVVGNGPDKPVASNASFEGRSRNRRTDVSIVRREPGEAP
jgi:NitT/TauT family transport system substrate-binding protein